MSYRTSAAKKTFTLKLLPLSIMVAMGVGLTTLPVAAFAQGAEQSPIVDKKQRFNIRAGSLDSVLNQFALAANINLSVDSRITVNLESPGLSGQFSIKSGLQKILNPVGLLAVQTSTNSFAIKSASTNDDLVLPTMNINASALDEHARGPVNGYVATRSASANKTDTLLIETPRSVTVVTSEQIEDRKALTVEDAVAYAAGVRVGNSGFDPRFDQITIRGYEVTTNADYRDGLRQPNTGWLSYFRTEPYGLERIEVVKGPDSVLFGQISPGGLVNRVSKRPTGERIREVEVQAGSYDHYQGQFDLSDKLGNTDEWSYRLTGLARNSDSDVGGVIDDNFYLAPSFTWKPSEDTSLTFLAQHQRYETAGSPRPFQLPSGELTHFWSGDNDFDQLLQKQTSVGYEFEHRFNDTFTFRQNARYSYVDTTNQYTSGSLNADGHTVDRSAWGIYEGMHNFALDTALESHFKTGSAKHTFLSGIDFYEVNSNVIYATGSAPSIDMDDPDYHQTINRPDTVYTDSQTIGRQAGIYLQDQISLDNWRFSAGLRNDWVNKKRKNDLTDTQSSTEESKATASAGLLYKFENGVAPYLSYASSFIPQFSTNTAGDELKPTEGQQWEVGVKYQPTGSKSFYSASLFDLKEKNVLTQDPVDINNRIQKGEKSSQGLELEANLAVTSQLDLIASYTYQDASISKSNDGDQGNKFVGVPEHMASIWTNYDFDNSWELGMGVRWVGESYSDSDNTSKNEDYTLVEGRAAYDLDQWLPGATLSVNASNLFDKEYLICDSGYCYRGAGRKVVASLNYNW